MGVEVGVKVGGVGVALGEGCGGCEGGRGVWWVWQWERSVVGVAVGEGCGEGGRGVGMGMEVGRGVKWTHITSLPSHSLLDIRK